MPGGIAVLRGAELWCDEPRDEVSMPDQRQLLERLYDRFNARDMDSVISMMHPDVLWANGMEGGHVNGRDAVRAYWTRQWAVIDPHVEPVDFLTGPDKAIIVQVHQTVRDREGTLISDRMVGHVFSIEDGLVTRFDIRAG
jgi:hypothetical protein